MAREVRMRRKKFWMVYFEASGQNDRGFFPLGNTSGEGDYTSVPRPMSKFFDRKEAEGVLEYLLKRGHDAFLLEAVAWARKEGVLWSETYEEGRPCTQQST